MELQDKIKQLRLEKGMTLEEVGNRVGVGKSTVRKWENGDIKNMRRDKIALLAAALGVSPAYLMGWTEDKSASGLKNELPVSHLFRVQVVGSVRCGPGGLAYHDVQGTELADVPNPREYFYLRATGHSMEPKILDGDFVLVHIQHDVESGELAVVVIDGEEGTLKKVIKKGSSVILQAFNPEFPPRVFSGPEIQTLRIAGKVVQLMRKM